VRRRIAPVFVPNLGCPHRCVFCDQRAITGAPPRLPTREDIEAACALYLGSARARHLPRQLAFYGGSFTALPPADQERLLSLGQELIERGQIDSLRLSTRPDAVAAAGLDRLAAFGVRSIELGAQSFDDAVLAQAGRGHAAADTLAAAALIRAANLELGLQLMCGLPGQTGDSFLASCRTATALGASFVRLYPVLVLEGTQLAAMWRRGTYQPLSLEEAVEQCRLAAEVFAAAGIPIIRTGLPHSGDLARAAVAGPHHPAFGQLVRSKAWLERLRREAAPLGPGRVRVEAAPRDIADVVGQRRGNLRRLKAELNVELLVAAGMGLAAGEIRLRRA